MISTDQEPRIVQRRASFEVEVDVPRPPFTVCREPPPVQYDTHDVPWDYGKGKTNVEEAFTVVGVTKFGRIYTFEIRFWEILPNPRHQL